MTLLLQLVHARASVRPLRQLGLEYSQISKLLTEAQESRYILSTDRGFVLTSEGLGVLDEESRGHRTGSRNWISPKLAMQTEKLDPDAIYLPPVRQSFY